MVVPLCHFSLIFQIHTSFQEGKPLENGSDVILTMLSVYLVLIKTLKKFCKYNSTMYFKYAPYMKNTFFFNYWKKR